HNLLSCNLEVVLVCTHTHYMTHSSHIHVHTHTHTQTHTHTHTPHSTHTPPHAHTHMHTHTHTHTSTHIYTHTHTHTRSHTYTLLGENVPSSLLRTPELWSPRLSTGSQLFSFLKKLRTLNCHHSLPWNVAMKPTNAMAEAI